MTAGYDPSNPVASGSSDGYESDRPRHAADEYDDPERLGPLPPRLTSTGSIPVQQSPATGSMPSQPTRAAPPPDTGFVPPQPAGPRPRLGARAPAAADAQRAAGRGPRPAQPARHDFAD